jgi:hypothetical protein
VHLPADAGKLQAWQAPPQALSQQTPSALQTPVRHSLVAVQRCPASFSPQLPETHSLGATQSALVAQSRGQTPAAHLIAPHETAAEATQLPFPLHVDAGTAEFPEHAGDAHVVPDEYREQDPLPSHEPLVLHEGAPSSLQILRGSVRPSATGTHSPGEDTLLHETHAPSQACAQQTPSAQKFDSHSSALVQRADNGFLPHEPFLQLWLGAHSLSALQPSKQEFFVASQPNGLQTSTLPGMHLPAWHCLIPATEAPLHVPATQVVPSGYLLQAPVPSHRPSSPQEATSDFWQSFSRAGKSPAGTALHRPIFPGRLQAMQVPLHSEEQQTPSTQNPEVHSADDLHIPDSGMLASPTIASGWSILVSVDPPISEVPPVPGPGSTPPPIPPVPGPVPSFQQNPVSAQKNPLGHSLLMLAEHFCVPFFGAVSTVHAVKAKHAHKSPIVSFIRNYLSS